MVLKFVMMVNKQGQTRLAQYYEPHPIEERVGVEAEIIRKCLSRGENQVRGRSAWSAAGSAHMRVQDTIPSCSTLVTNPPPPHSSHVPTKQCSFFEYRNYKVIYRRYASLFFIVGADNNQEENELAVLEFIHNMVETLDRYFENVVCHCSPTSRRLLMCRRCERVLLLALEHHASRFPHPAPPTLSSTV